MALTEKTDQVDNESALHEDHGGSQQDSSERNECDALHESNIQNKPVQSDQSLDNKSTLHKIDGAFTQYGLS